MTTKDIKGFISEIDSVKTDYEKAHALEDELREDFIKEVAKRRDEIGEMAKLILSTNEIEFARDCA
ncbi:MAG: hypothetical protein PHX83_12220 [Acidobacteriia bacterium]|nr:hypothetical protein [Terriglobia bacterium]